MARIAGPIVLVNVGLQFMGVVDTLMVGRLGGDAIAAVALGNFYFFNVSVFGLGLLCVLDPVIAQAVGAGDGNGVALGVQRGIIMSVMIAIVVMLLLMPADSVLRAFGQPESIIPDTAAYVRRRALGALPFFLFSVFRQTLQALGPVGPVVAAVAIANVVNGIANWTLVYGNLGSPALGVPGSGYATALAMWTLAPSVLVFAWPLLRDAIRPFRPATRDVAAFGRMLRLGLPIGTQWFLESFAFGLTALFMGWLGTASLAGHEIALSMASLTFMVPLGIAGAASAVVGRAVGRGDMASAKRDAIAATVCGVGFMCISALVFIAAPNWLATRYTTDPATLAVAVSLIPIAGVFQVFDGLQAVTGGVLRGTGDTRVPAILHMVAFWGVGIPLGAWLGFRTSMHERGFWWGLVAGLTVAALLQTWRASRRLSTHVARVRIDGHDGHHDLR